MSARKTASERAFSFLLIVFGWLSVGAGVSAAEPAPKPSGGLLDMSVEDLMKVEIVSTAALTKTQARLVPAAVTTITKEEIQGSSARSLFELLDIYVPNLQWSRNQWEADNLGLRGIINDRDDKYLLLVNGRVLNEHTHYGAITERDLVLLRDIHHTLSHNPSVMNVRLLRPPKARLRTWILALSNQAPMQWPQPHNPPAPLSWPFLTVESPTSRKVALLGSDWGPAAGPWAGWPHALATKNVIPINVTMALCAAVFILAVLLYFSCSRTDSRWM